MKALAGPAMLLVVFGGFFLYKKMSKEEAPDREFTNLELAGPAPDYQGTCYSMSTVFIANGVFGNVPRTWKQAGEDSWMLTLERVSQGYNGPVREYSSWTLTRHDQMLRLEKVDASAGQPQDPASSIDSLLEAPAARHSTAVDRCRKDGGTGYKFERK